MSGMERFMGYLEEPMVIFVVLIFGLFYLYLFHRDWFYSKGDEDGRV